ncbi:hypothetical protein EVAR_22323_1 [Eumeta japonica]|uniref:Uncharacterized protein n=1 Tax=Eumeta variegata TaxID=151549 RepID=A0A4C1UAK3_EUMVA|nr:hypothetical protein EVAR_22323_1 [Eumeta japonica]
MNGGGPMRTAPITTSRPRSARRPLPFNGEIHKVSAACNQMVGEANKKLITSKPGLHGEKYNTVSTVHARFNHQLLVSPYLEILHSAVKHTSATVGYRTPTKSTITSDDHRYSITIETVTRYRQDGETPEEPVVE